MGPTGPAPGRDDVAGTPADDPTDLQLLRDFLGGRSAAFTEMFDRHHRSVYGLALRITGDRLAAEDVAQETFLSLLRSAPRMDDESFRISAWIHKVASNLSYDQLRARSRFPEAPAAEPDLPDPVERVPESRESFEPERAFEGRELRRRIWEVSQRLPENYRLVLQMRELQGLSYRTIAEALGVSESAVETLLYRARVRFKEEYLMLESGGATEGQCATVKPLLRQYRTGRLRAAQRRQVASHLANCARCAGAYDELRASRGGGAAP
ncbi:MAG: RNA polymerase sigma factor [Candidatus Dormibacteria bacterium]